MNSGEELIPKYITNQIWLTTIPKIILDIKAKDTPMIIQ